MASVNKKINQFVGKTHEGALSRDKSAEAELRRTIMACLLWEDTFYESGKSIADRIMELIQKVDPQTVTEIAIEARTKQYLRHVPLLIVRELVRRGMIDPEARKYVRGALSGVIQRPDELKEFLAIYWKGKDKDQSLSAQVKKGLADAFGKFNAYQLAKYNNEEGAVSLRDVMFLVHPRPKDAEQAEVWKKLANRELESPDTWEVALSASKGEGKKEIWERLLKEQKLGAFALIRNLRNMIQAGVNDGLVREGLREAKSDKILPFRFLAALRAAPQYAGELEGMMLKNLSDQPKLPGTTILLVDVSGSMDHQLSTKSDLKRVDAAAGLAIMLREVCQSVRVASFSTKTVEVPAYRGLALAESIQKSQIHDATNTADAVKWANQQTYDRLMVITDEQASGGRMGWGSYAAVVPGPKNLGYMINVASYQNGIGYGPWVQIDGWSERVVDFVRAYETEAE